MTEIEDSKYNYIFAKRKVLPASELVKETGRLLYTEEQVYQVTDPLMRLFRSTVYANNITYDYFVFRFREYCRDRLAQRPDQVQTSVGNLKKVLYRNVLSYGKFKECMETLNYPILAITIKTIKNGEIITLAPL